VPASVLDKAMFVAEPEQIVCDDGVAVAVGVVTEITFTVWVTAPHPVA
jgi:hypothetical protein